MKFDVSIIYVYYNTPSELVRSIKSLVATTKGLKIEIIVVDNNSPKRVPRSVKQEESVNVIRNKINVGYGAGVNLGVSFANSEDLIVSNPDVEFFPGAVKTLLFEIRSKKIGLAGPLIVDKNNKPLPSISGKVTIKSLIFATTVFGKIFPTSISKNFWLINKNKSRKMYVPVISGACFAIRKEVFEKVGRFDKRFFLYFEEPDLCNRVQKLGLKILYQPQSKIFHKVSSSMKGNDFIEDQYIKSRLKFLKKYYPIYKAYPAELLLRMLTLSGIIFLFSVFVSLFLNLYQISTNMLFIGDFGRDYLAAREMIITGKIPLVGIPSSVVWLHQGPLSIYFIGLALFVGKFNPVAPAILYGVVGTGAVILIYFLAKKLFGRVTAAFCSLLFATAPIVVVGARMPYHTSSIPFFSILFFFILLRLMEGDRKYLPLLAFIMGLLLLLELSNAVVIFIVLALLLILRPKIRKSDIFRSFLCFFLGITPFILYDLTHRFVQTLGFPLWIINRIRLFVGIASPEKVTAGNIPEALARIAQQIIGLIFPHSLTISLFSISLFASFLFVNRAKILPKKRKISALSLLLLWIIIPLCAFVVHSAPGTAYFPFLYPAIAIAMGATFGFYYKKSKFTLAIVLVIALFNAYFTINNKFYLTGPQKHRSLPPYNYSFGTAFIYQQDAVSAVIKDAGNQPFWLEGGGLLKNFKSGINNYQYIALYKGAELNKYAVKKYFIYEDPNLISKNEKIVYQNKIIFITKK